MRVLVRSQTEAGLLPGPVNPKLDPRLWRDFCAEPQVAVEHRRLITKGTRFFTIGSCFAAEVRKGLTRAGFEVLPDYRSVAFDSQTQIFNHIPERDHTEHYDTFTIRQEFECAFDVWREREKGFWEMDDPRKMLSSDSGFQDPTRKITYGRTWEALADLSRKIDAVVKAGIAQADVFIITLGLTEVWQDNRTGRYHCRPPRGGLLEQSTFRQSSFLDNYANVKATLDLLFAHYPERQVILTVSPVPLERTHAQTDIGTANTESKAILRAVAGQICREYRANVSYFPSYEMATMFHGPIYEDDKRHVLPSFADQIVGGFMAAFS